MKLIYITSKTFPSGKVEPFIIKSMATAFAELLGQDFTLFIRGKVPPGFERMNTIGVKLPNRAKSLSYFIILPFWIIRRSWNKRDTIFFSSDPYLLAILIFWRGVFRFKYSICSEWHQLFDDWRDLYVANGSDFLISTSKTLRNFLSSRSGVDIDRIHVPYGGINRALISRENRPSMLEYRERLGLPKDAFLVGYAGAYKAMISVEKGIATMIKSLALIDKDITMYFVGGTKKEIEEYSELALKEGVSHKCVFLGKQLFKDLIEYERSMDVLVIANPDTPYFRNYCFPFKTWEYLSSGRPIIYSDLEIIDEILGARATPFKVGDPHSLARAINSVHEDMENKEKVAEKNLEDLKQFTWKARAQNVINMMST